MSEKSKSVPAEFAGDRRWANPTVYAKLMTMRALVIDLAAELGGADHAWDEARVSGDPELLATAETRAEGALSNGYTRCAALAEWLREAALEV